MKVLIILIGVLVIGCHSAETTVVHKSNETVQATKITSLTLQDGDLIFHTSRSSQSEAIQIVTGSRYSHIGVIYKEGGAFFVYEAVQPVKMTPLNDWIQRGVDGAYVVKRLENSAEILTAAGVQKMKTVGKKYVGKDYDLRFEWSDDKIYCSELVWKMYKEAFNIEIGKLEKIRHFDLSNPIVQEKVQERYGNTIPTNEWVITPDRMFRAKNLITIKTE
jgi:uncharacterized protein YycO